MNVSGISLKTPPTDKLESLTVGNVATIRAMSMAEDTTEDAMGTLLQSMDAMVSGVGANINQMA